MSSFELLFTVNEANEPVEPLPRATVHRDKCWHRTVGVWVMDRQRRVLCQKRSLNKDLRPGMWQAFCGEHLGPGEDYLDGARRGLQEELALVAKEADLVAYPSVVKSDKPTHKEFQQIFAIRLNGPTDEPAFDREEIDRLAWLTLDEVRAALLDEMQADWVHKPWDAAILDWLKGL